MSEKTELVQRLIQIGMRVTPQRLAIFQYLVGSDEHPTAQMIYQQLKPEFPSLSLATVYNTLETLVRAGIVNALGSAGDGRMHYDADSSPHINLACVTCHRVIDLPSQPVKALDAEVSQRSGYQILGARVVYYGVCPECQVSKP